MEPQNTIESQNFPVQNRKMLETIELQILRYITKTQKQK